MNLKIGEDFDVSTFLKKGSKSMNYFLCVMEFYLFIFGSKFFLTFNIMNLECVFYKVIDFYMKKTWMHNIQAIGSRYNKIYIFIIYYHKICQRKS